MTAESLNALARAYVPQLAGAINRASQAVVSGEVELTAGKFARVSLKSEKTCASAYIPNLGGVIE